MVTTRTARPEGVGFPESASIEQRRQRLQTTLAGYRKRIQEPLRHVVEGRLTRLIGLTLEAQGCQAPVGAGCRVICPNGQEIEAEVVGFSGERLLLMPIGSVRGVEVIDKIIARDAPQQHIALLQELCDTMEQGSLCAMGGLTPYPVRSALESFPEDFS